MDEDFQEDSESDVAEEYDSAHESSGTDSDAEMADGDGDAEADADGVAEKHTAAAVERPKKKAKTQK